MEKIVDGAEGRPTEPRAAVRYVKKRKRKKDLELLRRQVLEAKRNLRKEAAPSKVRKTSLTRALNYFADQRQENDKKTRGVDSTGKKVGKRKICTKLLSANEQRIGIFAKGSKGDRIKRGNQNLSEENRARLRGKIHRLMNGINSNWTSPRNFSDPGPPVEGNKSPILGNINRPKRHACGDEPRTRKHTKNTEFKEVDHIDLATAEGPPSRTLKENRYKRRLFEDDDDDNFGKMDRFFAEELRFSPKITPSGRSTTNDTPERNPSDREIANESESTKVPFFALRNANWSPTRRYERLCAMICSEKFESCLEEIQYTDPLTKARRTLMGIYADSCRQHLLRRRSNANNGFENSSTSSSLSETEDQVDVTEDTDVLSSAEDSDVFSDREKKHARRDGKEKDSLAAAQARSTNRADRRLSQIAESGSVDDSKEPFDRLDANKRKGVRGCKRNARPIFEQDSHESDEQFSMASLRVNVDAKSWNIADRPKSEVLPLENMSNVVEREAFMIKFLANLNVNKAKKDSLKYSPQEAYWSSPQMLKFLGAQSLDDSLSRQRNNVERPEDSAVLKLGNFRDVAEFEDLPRKMRFPRTSKYVPAILRRSKTRKSTEQADVSDPLFPSRVDIDEATEIAPQDEDPRSKNKYEMEAAPSFVIPKTEDLFQSRMTTDISFSEFETCLQTPSIVNAYLEHKNRLMKSKVNFMNAKYRTVSREICEDRGRQGYSRDEERNCVRQAKCGFDPKTTRGKILQRSSKEAASVFARNQNISTLQDKYVRELVPRREENPTEGESHKNCRKTVRFLRADSNGSAEEIRRASRERAANEFPRDEGQNCKASNSKCRDARDFGDFTELVSQNLTHAGMKADNFLRENQKQPDGLEILRCENERNQTHSYVSRNVGAQSELQKLVATSSFDNQNSRNPKNFHACQPADGLVRVIALENRSDTCRRPEFVERPEEGRNLCEDVQPAKYLAFNDSQNIQRIPIYIRNDRVGGSTSESYSGSLVNLTKNRQGEPNASNNVEHKIVILPRAEENSGILYAQETQAPRPLPNAAPGGAFQNSEVTRLGYPVAAAKNFNAQTAAPREFSQSGAAHRILQNVQIIEPLFQNKERNHCYPGVVYQEGDRMVASFMAEPIGITKNNENSSKQFENACSFVNGQDPQGQPHYAARVYSQEHPNPPKRIQLSDGTVGLLVTRNNSHPNMTQRQQSAADSGVVYTGQNSNFQLIIDPTYRDGGRTRNQTDGNWDHLHQRFVHPVYNIIDAHPSQVSTNNFPTGF